MAVVELDGLERRYGERTALAGVTVRVEEGQTLVVLGSNGAGKTTLLRVLAGLLRPHGGAVRVLGAELPRERWRLPGNVGYLGHEPLLYRELSGRENLRYHARLHGVDAARVDELLGAVGMESPRRRAACATSRAGWCSGWRWHARCCTTRRCCCSTSRAPASTRRRPRRLEPLIGRASGRTRVLVTHDLEGGAGRVRPGARPQGRAPGVRGRGRSGAARGSSTRDRARRGRSSRKDLLLEWRTKESVPAMALFTLTTYVLFHFGLDRDSLDGELASGVLWVTLLLAAVIGVTRLFAAEREQGGIDGAAAGAG